MKKKKLISLLLAATCIGSMALTGCGEKEKGGGKEADNELPTVTFTHGYYQDETEWAPAAEVESPEGKHLVQACQTLQNADVQVLGWGNTFGDMEGEIQNKYAGLKDGSKTAEDVAAELDQVLAAE